MENVSHDAPHVVDEVRVVEIHAPAFFLGRETAQHQQACVGRKERLQGMLFGWNGGGGICWCHVYLSVCFTFMKIQSDIKIQSAERVIDGQAVVAVIVVVHD